MVNMKQPAILVKAIKLATVAVGSLAISLVFYVAYSIVEQGYGWSEMDWSEDGRTSLNELIVSMDVGKREIYLEEGLYCKEYYNLKDGMTLKITCDDKRLTVIKKLIDTEQEHRYIYQIIKDGKTIRTLD